ncbi:hypothetical protein [Actinomadura miaoliensis]|uniref:hypothetical protein n=1 Tax=Actinomadura miaoliensis TaxID=430685 RepID=UPI0031F16776
MIAARLGVAAALLTTTVTFTLAAIRIRGLVPHWPMSAIFITVAVLFAVRAHSRRTALLRRKQNSLDPTCPRRRDASGRNPWWVGCGSVRSGGVLRASHDGGSRVEIDASARRAAVALLVSQHQRGTALIDRVTVRAVEEGIQLTDGDRRDGAAGLVLSPRQTEPAMCPQTRTVEDGEGDQSEHEARDRHKSDECHVPSTNTPCQRLPLTATP